MVKIVLIRPGATELDEQSRVQGTLDLPLSEKGGAAVSRLVDELRNGGIEVVYAAEGQPALQTAETVASGLDIKLKKLDNMRNLDHGLWQGMAVDEIRRKHPKVYRQWQEQPRTICPPNGEMLADAESRVRAALTRLLKRHPRGTIALVVPEPLAQIVRCQLSDCQLGDLWTSAAQHDQWEVFEAAPRELARTN
ncbi:MAG: histidine phosphatase family protein [Pirellulales bacterium]|nr:histidine phosphatase family protein [Planctomycetales bacterium]